LTLCKYRHASTVKNSRYREKFPTIDR